MDWELVVGVDNFFAVVHMVQTPCMTLEVSAFTLPSTAFLGSTLSPGFRVSVPVPYVFCHDSSSASPSCATQSFKEHMSSPGTEV